MSKSQSRGSCSIVAYTTLRCDSWEPPPLRAAERQLDHQCAQDQSRRIYSTMNLLAARACHIRWTDHPKTKRLLFLRLDSRHIAITVYKSARIRECNSEIQHPRLAYLTFLSML